MNPTLCQAGSRRRSIDGGSTALAVLYAARMSPTLVTWRRFARIAPGFLLMAAALSACANPAMPMGSPSGTAARTAKLHLSPTCTCCTEYAAYLRRNGWTVEEIEEQEISAFQRDLGIPEAARGCHTTLIDGYVVDGHVPLAAVGRPLAERPAIDGIALPGMPLGSPGMAGPAEGPMVVVAFDGTEVTLYGEY